MMITQKLNAMEVLNRDWTDAIIVARIWVKVCIFRSKNCDKEMCRIKENQRCVGHIIMNYVYTTLSY